jgi:hypothetical protein
MAKISKEQGQRIFLGILLLVGAGAGGWMFLLAPQIEAIESSTRQITDLETSIKTAKRNNATSKAVAEKTAALSQVHDELVAGIPEGAPITWFPPKMDKFFRQQGIEEASISRGAVVPTNIPGLDKFEEFSWAASIPKVSFGKLGAALAELETTEPLIQVTSLTIAFNATEPESQRVDFSFNVILPKDPTAAR